MKALVLMVVVAACGSRSDSPRTKPYPPGSGRPKAAAVACPATRAPGDAVPEISNGNCKKDDDCTAGKNGRCRIGGARVRANNCTYDACFVDADCKSGGPCECSEYGNACLAGNCRTDADCGANGACGRSNAMSCGGGAAAYYCRTPADTCESYDDCKNNTSCVFSLELGHWACVAYPRCPVG